MKVLEGTLFLHLLLIKALTSFKPFITFLLTKMKLHDPMLQNNKTTPVTITNYDHNRSAGHPKNPYISVD